MQSANTEKGYWNGEPALFSACKVILKECELTPLHWQNAFVGKERECIEVIYNNESFLIDNENGTGFYKVTQGMGSPNVGHSSIADHVMLDYIDVKTCVRVIKHHMIDVHFQIVDAYQKAKNPAEYERMQAIKKHMESFQKMSNAEKIADINSRMVKGANPSKKFKSKDKKDGNGKR